MIAIGLITIVHLVIASGVHVCMQYEMEGD